MLFAGNTTWVCDASVSFRPPTYNADDDVYNSAPINKEAYMCEEIPLVDVIKRHSNSWKARVRSSEDAENSCHGHG